MKRKLVFKGVINIVISRNKGVWRGRDCREGDEMKLSANLLSF